MSKLDHIKTIKINRFPITQKTNNTAINKIVHDDANSSQIITKANIGSLLNEFSNNEDRNKTMKQMVTAVSKTYHNIPHDAQEIHLQITELSAMGIVAQVQVARRLKSIRDNKHYETLGYNDFKVYCEDLENFNKTSIYNYINVIEVFGDSVEMYTGNISNLIQATPYARSIDEQSRKELMHTLASLSAREARSLIQIYQQQIEKAPPVKKTTHVESHAHANNDNYLPLILKNMNEAKAMLIASGVTVQNKELFNTITHAIGIINKITGVKQ